jgi:Mg2+/Co2+ transporter CorB
MLLNVLDLGKAAVEDIMVPRNEVVGIDIDDSIPDILKLIRTTEYTRMPVYEGDINNVVGVLHLRNAARFICGSDEMVTHEAIRKQLYTPYFVPESTPLHTQLMNFQKEKRRFAIAVDEYGDVQGIVTLVDLLEEIVGDFSTDIAQEEEQEIVAVEDDWYRIDATASVRDINRHLGWELPTDGPKTINGIIVEHLENIPDAPCGFQIGSYRFEVTELSETRIEQARIKEELAR